MLGLSKSILGCYSKCATDSIIAQCQHCQANIPPRAAVPSPVPSMTTGARTQTYHYHGSDLKRMQLCKPCYDVYLAKEMVSYWQDHMAEEQRRTGASS